MSKPYEDGDVLRFGKHRGSTIDAVIADDPGWVEWAWDTIANWIDLRVREMPA